MDPSSLPPPPARPSVATLQANVGLAQEALAAAQARGAGADEIAALKGRAYQAWLKYSTACRQQGVPERIPPVDPA